jgi:hypothetical protein
MVGVFENLFGLNLPLIDMPQLSLQSLVSQAGDLSTFELNGLGIFGMNCLANATAIQNLNPLSNASQTQAGVKEAIKAQFVQITVEPSTKENPTESKEKKLDIAESCVLGNINLFVNTADYTSIHSQGHINISDVKTFIDVFASA